jgi:hypothetical protein
MITGLAFCSATLPYRTKNDDRSREASVLFLLGSRRGDEISPTYSAIVFVMVLVNHIHLPRGKPDC